MKPVRLFADKIKDNLRTDIIGREIVTLERTVSAMDTAKQMLKEGAIEGTTIFAEEQTRGRGRTGREWFCKSGKGLLLTVVLRPAIQPESSYILMVFTAVAIVQTIRDMFKLPVEIDWPNDIVINKKKLGGIIVETHKSGKGLLLTVVLRPAIQPESSYILMVFTAVAIVQTIRDMFKLPVEIDWPNDIVINKKKLGGIIVETQDHTDQSKNYIVGIGINVNLKKHELPEEIGQPATSLTIEKEAFIDRTNFARALLQNLDSWYLILKEKRYDHIVDKWQEYCMNIGRRVNVRNTKKEFEGVFLGITKDGELILQLDDGRKKKFKVEHTIMNHQPPSGFVSS